MILDVLHFCIFAVHSTYKLRKSVFAVLDWTSPADHDPTQFICQYDHRYINDAILFPELGIESSWIYEWLAVIPIYAEGPALFDSEVPQFLPFIGRYSIQEASQANGH